jgi:hypothetical protein
MILFMVHERENGVSAAWLAFDSLKRNFLLASLKRSSLPHRNESRFPNLTLDHRIKFMYW